MVSSSSVLSKSMLAAVVGTLMMASVASQDSGTSLSLTGHLSDMLCARLEIAPDGANMLLNPEDHTVRCQLLPACLRSGYGLTQDIGSDGDKLYRVGAVFDESGNDFVVDILNSMDTTINDIRVKVKGTVVDIASAAVTPSIASRVGEGFWPAMNNIPLITIDSLEFCNYDGPDANFPTIDVCSSDSILDLLASPDGRDTLANANLCMREEISLVSDEDNIIVGHSGCADHATFQDVKRADAQSCSQTASPDCDQTCEDTDTCAAECVDVCGNPLVLASGATAKACCLDACGNPMVDPCGFPYLDACGNPTLADGSMCPATSAAENQVNECFDACGSPITDSCGNPVDVCCLDVCGSPILDPCGFPWLDPCGNPSMNANGDACANLGANVCLPTAGDCDHICEDTDTCKVGCVDVCGNPLVVASGATAKSCCLDACGNPLLDGCGFPFYDACGNPTSGYSGEACPASQIAANDVNECFDACGSPITDSCGNPVDSCCLDVCGSPILDPCGFPWLDPCGNPAMNANGDACANLGANVCLGGSDSGDDTCSPAALFPPATGGFQCEGLLSPCTIAMDASTEVTDGIPSTVVIGRRRAAASMTARKLQSEPSVPLYTPLKKDLRFKIPSNPTSLRSRKELDPAHGGVIGVAVNGVPIVYEHPGEGANTLLFDSCGGHGDLSNRYHYHIPPVCLLRSLGGTVPRLGDWWLAPNAETQWPGKAKAGTEKSPLVGWAIDGNPIFGPYNPENGELVAPGGASGGDECTSNTLDECNGMVLENGVYAYFITPTAPFVPPCLMGEVLTEAFVDGGLMDGEVSTCPFEGTDPLAGTEICDEKTIIFSDDSCPGNADRQAIRNCFELATSSFVGAPTCSQMEDAIAKSTQCFLSAGCCQDLQQTVMEWTALYPSLEECTLLELECAVFGDDNVVEITVQLAVDVNDLVPDTRALLRKNVAASLDVEPDRVVIERVTGTNETATVVFGVAYATKEDAAAATESLDTDAITSSLEEASGFTVSSLNSAHSVPPEPLQEAELWTTRLKAGLGSSLVAVLVVLGMVVYFEDKPKVVAEAQEAPAEKEPTV